MTEMEKELKVIRKELVLIRKCLEHDALSPADIRALHMYHAEKMRGKLNRHEELKKELA